MRLAGRQAPTFLDIRPLVLAGGEQGLLSVAFHPRYTKNRLFYVDYTDRAGKTIIAEYRARGVKPAVVRTLMSLPDPAANHNGGQLVFGPTGTSGGATATAAAAATPTRTASRPTGFFAKLMRLDVGSAHARWQIWRSGCATRGGSRSTARPARCTSATSARTTWEEIDYVPKGASHLNFGWNALRGRREPFGTETLLPGWR